MSRKIIGKKAPPQGGSTHLVVGRAIRDAPDPAEAANKIIEEIQVLDAWDKTRSK